MRVGRLGLRAEDLPLGFQIGRVCHPDDFDKLLGSFDAAHRGKGRVGCCKFGGRAEDNSGEETRRPIIRDRLNFLVSARSADPSRHGTKAES